MTEQIKHKNQAPKEDLTREEENMLYWIGVIALPIGVIGGYVIVNWLIPNMPPADCIFWKWLGVYCPGCGGTRAVIALVHGDILLSAWYHPLVIYAVVLYAIYMLTHTLEKLHIPFVKGMRFRGWYLYGALVIIGVNCILKNVLKFGFGIMM